MKTRFYIILFILATFGVSGCINRERLLGRNEYLLYNQRIDGNRRVSSSTLEGFYRQQANSRLFGTPFMPGLWFYSFGSQFHNPERIEQQIAETRREYDQRIAETDPEREGRLRRLRQRRDNRIENLQTRRDEGNFLMRRLGSPPVIFDTAQARMTNEQIRSYYRTKGFFNVDTRYSYELDTARRFASVTYHVTEQEPYIVRELSYETDNPTIDSLLRFRLPSPAIRAGMQYDEALIGQHRDQIERLLRNNGYFEFSKQYIAYEVDTTVVDSTLGRHVANVFAIINRPANRETHRQFRLGAVYFTTDAGTQLREGRRDTAEYNGVQFIAYDTDRFSRPILNSKLYMHPGELYSLDNTMTTQRLLNSLDMFRFANVFFDTTGTNLVARISTSPVEKYSISNEIGANVSQGFPGPFINSTFRARNVFGGMETFEVTLRGLIDGQAGVTDQRQLYASQEVGISAALIFPQLLLPGGLQYQFGRYNPKTRIQAGFNYTNRPEYRRYNIRTGLTYSFQKDLKHSWTFSPLDLNFLNTTFIDSTFQATLDTLASQGSNLFRSFLPSFVSDINASYTFNDNAAMAANRPTHFFRIYGEIGGLLANVIERTTLFEPDDIEGIQFFRFFRINPDFRYYLPLNATSSLAFRVHVGIASPLGRTVTLPYERFFFSGGSNSIRAWPVRRLGPGSTPIVVDSLGNIPRNEDGSLNLTDAYRFEQPGDLLVETSVEYRFPLVSFLEGALFIDAGNVWILRSQVQPVPDEDGQPVAGAVQQGQFQFRNLLRETAVGTGFGLRLDFQFLILRFDLGVKAYDPGRPVGERFVFRDMQARWPFFAPRQVVFNIGIGYPF